MASCSVASSKHSSIVSTKRHILRSSPPALSISYTTSHCLSLPNSNSSASSPTITLAACVSLSMHTRPPISANTSSSHSSSPRHVHLISAINCVPPSATSFAFHSRTLCIALSPSSIFVYSNTTPSSLCSITAHSSTSSTNTHFRTDIDTSSDLILLR